MAGLVALALVMAAGCGSADEPTSLASIPASDGSLAPGPSVDNLVSISTTDLVIEQPADGGEALRAAISELGGEIHFDSEQLSLYGVRFDTASAEALAEIRDELRRRGFDASFDIESDDPTTT